jgi:vacuolar-type H+-ATPase subunit F/Vma7
MDLKEYILIGLAAGNFITMIVGFYKVFRDPDINADKQLGINAVACNEKHKRLDEIIVEIKDKFKSIDNSILLIKENDIKHIEQEMRRMSDAQIEILTILEYKKQKNKKDI